MAATASAGGDSPNENANTQTRTTQWGNAVTGTLADDFLRIEGGGSVGVNPAAYYNSMFAGTQQQGGILNITLVQARLAKNYGMTRMDPYCRIRVGIQVFETPTSYNGSKTPRWNKLIQCHIPDTLKDFHLEIFDECSFSIDERIAWGTIKLTDAVFDGDTVENWHSLCGKQGEDKEGMIHIVLKYQKFEGAAMMGGPMMQSPMMVVNPMGTPMVVNSPPMYGYNAPFQPAILTQQTIHPAVIPQQQIQQNGTAQHAQQVPNQINERDLKTLKEMCPSMDEDIIQSVLQQSGGNIDQAAGQLLEMSGS